MRKELVTKKCSHAQQHQNFLRFIHIKDCPFSPCGLEPFPAAMVAGFTSRSLQIGAIGHFIYHRDFYSWAIVV